MHLGPLCHWKMESNLIHRRYESSQSNNRDIINGFATEFEFHEEADRTLDVVMDECNKLYEPAGDEFDYHTAVWL